MRDRKKDIIISGGENISTIEVEQAFVSHPAVLECAVVATPDERWGERPKAFVTLKPGFNASPAAAEELRGQVAREIGKFARPDEIRFADGLPKTRSGKIMRRLLKDIAAGREIKGDLSTLEDHSILDKLSK